MTLQVPLTVSVGGKHLTRKVEGLAFRKEAVGGVASITISLSAPLSTYALTALSKVKVMDARSATVIAEGRVADPGRTADESGQKWTTAAAGPAWHASDITNPLHIIDQSLSDGWRRVKRTNSAGGDIGQTNKPGTDGQEAIVAHFAQGKDVDTNNELAWRYDRIKEAEQRLGRVTYDWDTGQTNASYAVQMVPVLDNVPDSAAKSSTFNTAGGTHTAVYSTDFTTGRNQFDLQVIYTGGATTNPANDKFWASFQSVIIRSILKETDASDQTCTTNYVEADWVVRHLLGAGLLPQYDAANAEIDTTGTYQIDQMVYPDGVTPAEVLEDLMKLEPAHYWTTGPDVTGSGYSFAWKTWPTSVRYEATLEDGGDFPTSTQELYNRVLVRWVDVRGRSRSTLVSGTCEILDDAGLVRRAVLDVSNELGSGAAATRLGENFLAAHQYPPNMGTLNVARKIRDLETGRMVEPFEIEPGNLIRVRGVESYPDALNASSNDGQTVFRIWAMNYSSDGNSAQLELDTYPRNTVQALARLQRQRNRKR